jgi:hypothetical protein
VSAEYRPAVVRERLQRLQSLDDAIAYRRARISDPCPDCGPADGDKCDDHACDLLLIANYRQTAEAITGDAPGSRRTGIPA